MTHCSASSRATCPAWRPRTCSGTRCASASGTRPARRRGAGARRPRRCTALARRVKQASASASEDAARVADHRRSSTARSRGCSIRPIPCRQRGRACCPSITGYDAEMVRLGLTSFCQTLPRAATASLRRRGLRQSQGAGRIPAGGQGRRGPRLRPGAAGAQLGRQRAGAAAVEPGLRPAGQGRQHRQAAQRRAGVRRPVRAAAGRGASAAGRLPGRGLVEGRRRGRGRGAVSRKPTRCWPMAATTRSRRSARRCRSPRASCRTATSWASA